MAELGVGENNSKSIIEILDDSVSEGGNIVSL